jgi:hypothetical protein
MALASVRYEYKIALSHVDEGVERELTIIAARHPSETASHLTLRVIAACVLTKHGVEMGPGLSDGEASDLEAHDATGALTCWVECGAVDAQKLRRIVQGNPGAEVHVVLSDERRRRELEAGIATLPHGIKDAHRVLLWNVDDGLVNALSALDDRRQKWTFTLVDGHAYIDVDGVTLEGEITSAPLG